MIFFLFSYKKLKLQSYIKRTFNLHGVHLKDFIIPKSTKKIIIDHSQGKMEKSVVSDSYEHFFHVSF